MSISPEGSFDTTTLHDQITLHDLTALPPEAYTNLMGHIAELGVRYSVVEVADDATTPLIRQSALNDFRVQHGYRLGKQDRVWSALCRAALPVFVDDHQAYRRPDDPAPAIFMSVRDTPSGAAVTANSDIMMDADSIRDALLVWLKGGYPNGAVTQASLGTISLSLLAHFTNVRYNLDPPLPVLSAYLPNRS